MQSSQFLWIRRSNISAMLESSSHPSSPAAPAYLFNAVVANVNINLYTAVGNYMHPGGVCQL